MEGSKECCIYVYRENGYKKDTGLHCKKSGILVLKIEKENTINYNGSILSLEKEYDKRTYCKRRTQAILSVKI